MRFSKSDSNYLGSTVDMADHKVDGFLIDNKIYVVHNLGEEHEMCSFQPLNDILSDPDKYMWTPYAIFYAKIKGKV